MSNIKISILLFLIFLFKDSLLLSSPDSLYFFQAKSNIIIKHGNTEESYTANIRYNVKDSLWVSFTGTLGIEGMRILITKDSSFVINKLEKTAYRFSSSQENYFIPFGFSLNDWKTVLLNIPFSIDSNTNIMNEENWKSYTTYDATLSRKIFIVNNQISKCEYRHKNKSQYCNILFENYSERDTIHPLALKREIEIQKPNEQSVYISLVYVDYQYNSPKPFLFNIAKYKNAEAK